MKIRLAQEADMPACEAIYAHHVLNGVATFDEVVPASGHLHTKFLDLRAEGFGFFVCEVAGHIAGYAYAAPFRARSAYRFSAEDSIYLHPDFVGQGLAAPLFSALIAATRDQGLRTLIAVIGMDQDQDEATNPSYRAHLKAGFEPSGGVQFVGYKFDRWLKTIYMCVDLHQP